MCTDSEELFEESKSETIPIQLSFLNRPQVSAAWINLPKEPLQVLEEPTDQGW